MGNSDLVLFTDLMVLLFLSYVKHKDNFIRVYRITEYIVPLGASDILKCSGDGWGRGKYTNKSKSPWNELWENL